MNKDTKPKSYRTSHSPPALCKLPTQVNAKVNSDEFKYHWRKKADKLREQYEKRLCIRAVSKINPISMRIIQGYCDAMEELEKHFADEEVVTVDYRIAAMHSILTAINVIQADLSGLDEL